MTLTDEAKAAAIALRATLGVPAAALHVHFSDDCSEVKVFADVAFKAEKVVDAREKRA